jgi:hypothetical protein
MNDGGMVPALLLIGGVAAFLWLHAKGLKSNPFVRNSGSRYSAGPLGGNTGQATGAGDTRTTQAQTWQQAMQVAGAVTPVVTGVISGLTGGGGGGGGTSVSGFSSGPGGGGAFTPTGSTSTTTVDQSGVGGDTQFGPDLPPTTDTVPSGDFSTGFGVDTYSPSGDVSDVPVSDFSVL